MKKESTLKRLMIIGCMALLAACSETSVEPAKVPPVSLDSEKAKFSYAIGMDVGKRLQDFGSNIETDVLLAALKDSLEGKESRVPAQEAAEIIQAFLKKQGEDKAAEQKIAGEQNKAEGLKFLAENGKKDGVTTTASGLQYEVLKQGDGARPKATDKVKVHYRGTLLDGTEFDSSYKRGQPISFPLNGVIPGWTEGVQLMNVGSTFKFVIPSELAYGDRGAGPQIGPGNTLIFEVELLGIETEEKAG
jgi:FKBP-type peptidyl-prolyl cis-trans isomerase FkpA/FKBP-type peptidyl-prolyl cis-trans isomerase FklB